MIKKIRWENHEILGNLELDFLKQDGTPYNTIILAGENGTGKTTILETLAEFLNLGSIKPFKEIEYIINENPYKISKYYSYEDEYGFHIRKNLNNGAITDVHTNKNNNLQILNSDLEDIRYYGFVYSKARSGFVAGKIKNTSTQQLDSNKYENDENNDFTFLKQLIVNVASQDNAELMRKFKNNELESDFFEKNSKLFRFTKAFNGFFNDIKFKEVDFEDPNELKILFEKNNKEIAIDALSTGEKQIVFRGAYLLRNLKNISNGTVLIDEPELSMHPKWQEKILKYYRDLFTDNGVQNQQIIIATHSDYVIKSALEDKDNVLIIDLSNNNGNIITRKITSSELVLPTVTAAETNYLVFGIPSPEYHISLYGYLQYKSGTLQSIKDCDDYIVSCIPTYNPKIHKKISGYRTTTYKTLPTYIRNAIDHPLQTNIYTRAELECSIELLRNLCK